MAHTSCCPWLSGPLRAPPVASPPDSGPGGGEQGDARGQPGQCPASAPSPPPQGPLLTCCDGTVHLVPLAPGPALDPDGCAEPRLCPLCPFPVGWASRSWLLPRTLPCHGCTQVTLRLWPPSVSFPGGCPLGSPVPSNLSQWGSSQPVWGSKPPPTPSLVQRFQDTGQQRPWHRVTQGFLSTLLQRLLCSRSCPRPSGCLSVKPGHRGCPGWQQGPTHLAARSRPAPCRNRLVGHIFHPVTGLWQGQAAPRQGS